MKFLVIIILCYYNLHAQTVMHIWKNGAKIDSVQVTDDLNLTFSTNQQVINPELEVEMVTVQGGTFMMGGNGGNGSLPIHSVTLSTFKISKYEVTQKLWKAVMGTNPSYFIGNDNRPIENVSWDDVQQFIIKLNQLTGKNYRMPTEAEWEFAARGGNLSQGYSYAGGNNLDDVAWYRSNSNNTTHEVGTKSPNELGIYDMSGNVYEYLNDWYSATYYSISPNINPQGPGTGVYHCLRGGSWTHPSVDQLCVFRGYSIPDNLYFRGARLAHDN